MGIFSRIKSLFSDDTATPVMTNCPVVMAESDKKNIEDSARSMVHVINESLKIANKSAVYDTRVSRIQVVKNTLASLKKLSISYPDVSITSLDAVEDNIKAVERETQNMKPIVRYKNLLPERPDIVPQTAEEATRIHNAYIGDLMDVEDSVLKGAVYRATPQLRTPLWILLKDGEKCGNGMPPTIGEPWHGIWVPDIKTWKELGIEDMKEFSESESSSDIGYVMHSEYIPFLIDIRKAVETDESLKCRIELLRQTMREKKYAKFVKRHSGQNKIIDYFFPPITDAIPGISSTVSTALHESKITTIHKLRKISDKDLLAIKGIGPGALKKIREFTDCYCGDDKLDRVDAVQR